jgi:SAM-dependent methyltransferase
MFNPPIEFDINIYRKKNIHLQSMTNKQLIDHYNNYGFYEGLLSSDITNRFDLINLIPQDKDILEIGPLAFPSMDVNRSNVQTIDYFTQEELKENYKNDNNVDIDKICKVNYVIKGQTKYSDIIDNRFDFCFSSHNIEHVPCIITFLNNISSVLKDNGHIVLCIPDYQYCFDHFKVPSTIFDVLNNFHIKNIKPTNVNILESKFYQSHNNSVIHWNNFEKTYNNIFIKLKEYDDFITEKKSDIINNINEIKKLLINETYIDSHVWKFTPLIFKTIIEILESTNYIDLSILRLYKTLKHSNEFYVVLKKK